MSERAPMPGALFIMGMMAFFAAGCDSDSSMATQPKYDTYDPAPGVFADGASARPIVAGTVARDPERVPGIPYAVGPTTRPGSPGAVVADSPDGSIPFAVDAEVLRNGQFYFESFCSVCHGRLGNGEGMIPQRGFTHPPSFHVDRLRQAPDVHFFDVISNGYGAMFSYSERIAPRHRWEIVAYVRALQAAPDALGDSLLPADRAALIAGGDRIAPPASQPAASEGRR